MPILGKNKTMVVCRENRVWNITENALEEDRVGKVEETHNESAHPIAITSLPDSTIPGLIEEIIDCKLPCNESRWARCALMTK